MLILKSMHLINLHFWTYSISKGRGTCRPGLKGGFSPSVPLRVVSLNRSTAVVLAVALRILSPTMSVSVNF